MQVGEPLGGADRDAQPHRPLHHRPPFPCSKLPVRLISSCPGRRSSRRRVIQTMEVVLEGLVGHELVDEQPVRAVHAVPDEGDEVAVVHAADGVHLRLELALALPAPGLELLHRHLLAAREHAAVHVPEPALPQQVRLREPARRRRQLCVAERGRVQARGHRQRRRRHGRRQPAGRARDRRRGHLVLPLRPRAAGGSVVPRGVPCAHATVIATVKNQRARDSSLLALAMARARRRRLCACAAHL
jgi:hypothetical protein